MKKKCSICGRETNKTHNIYGYKCVCDKHYQQIIKHKKPLDNIPRTNNDLNDYVIIGDTAIFNLYNLKNIKIGEFVIDREDLKKVKYHKWRLSKDRVRTGSPSKNNER